MKSFSSQDMQRTTGDLQVAAAAAPIIITSHGKPRNVMMSLDEFRRLKAAAGEDLPVELRPNEAPVIRAAHDALGYDTSDISAAASRMAEDELGGNGADEVQKELASVRRRFAVVSQ